MRYGLEEDELFKFGVSLMREQAARIQGEDMKADTKKSIDNYLKYGYAPGAFLEAVFSNNLQGALCFADEQNSKDLRKIIKYINEKAPAAAWGSDKAVSNWILSGGLRGQQVAV